MSNYIKWATHIVLYFMSCKYFYFILKLMITYRKFSEIKMNLPSLIYSNIVLPS